MQPPYYTTQGGVSEAEIGAELTVGAGQRFYPAGTYHSAAREPTGMNVLPGFGQTLDGSTIHEPSMLSQVNITNFLEHGGINRSAGLIVTVTAKKFQTCDWETQYTPGTAVFSLDVENMYQYHQSDDSLAFMHPTYPASWLATPAHLNTLFDKAREAFKRRLDDEASAGLGTTGPFTILSGLLEEQWYDPKLIPDGVIYKTAVEECFLQEPSIGLCNGQYIRHHVFFLGVIESKVDADDIDGVLVAVAVAQGAHMINYWGKHLCNLDRCGFVVTKRKDSGIDAGAMTSTDYRRDSFICLPFRHPTVFQPGLSIRNAGYMASEPVATGRHYSYDITVGNRKINVQRQPAIVYNAGIVVLRETMDTTALGDDRQCYEIIGVARENRIDAAQAHITSTVADRSVYLHIATR